VVEAATVDDADEHCAQCERRGSIRLGAQAIPPLTSDSEDMLGVSWESDVEERGRKSEDGRA
jgi:hypothetical protein